MKNDSVLKKLAFDAKNRLKHCTYKNREENQNIRRNIAFQNHVRIITESECKTPEITIKVINDYAEEEAFSHKVYELLKKNADCINPLKELSDEQMLREMNETERQKYILNLAEHYTQVRNDYIRTKVVGI